MLAQSAAPLDAGGPLSPEQRAWLNDLTEQLRGALEPAADAAELHQAATLLLSALLEARPASSRRSDAELPPNACVASASALTSYSARGRGACGDLQRVWAAARSHAAPAPQQQQPLLPVQPWLVAGVLRCGADGLSLESQNGLSILVEARDALAAMPLVNRPVLAQRWALPPSSGLPPVLEVHRFVPLDTLSAVCARTPLLSAGCAAGAVVAVSPLLRIRSQTFCIAELRCCGNGRVQHVFLDKEALRWRASLSSAAGRGCCVVLSDITPRILFPEQPERCWPVLVASAFTALSLHGCSSRPAPSVGMLCACDTCLRGDTCSVVAEVLELDPSDAGLALRVRVGAGSCHAGREVPLLLAHQLSGAPSPWQLPGVRPGAEIILLHAHPVVRQGMLLALGACSRTTLRCRSFSPLCASTLPLLHTDTSRMLLARAECASFADVLDMLGVHACASIKLPRLRGAAAAVDASMMPAAFVALLRVLAPSASNACRGVVYEELLASSRSCARSAAASDAAIPSWKAPSMAEVSSAAVKAWHSRGSAASSGSDWLCDTLDGAPLIRLVVPFVQLLEDAVRSDAAPVQPARLLAWLNRSADGWALWDASGHLEAALEGQPPSTWGENECVLLSNAYVVVEGGRAAHLAGAAPARVYVAFHAAAVERIPELDAEPPLQRWRYYEPMPHAAQASVRSLLRWNIAALPGSTYVSVTGRVVGECLRSCPHITGVPAAAVLQSEQASQGTRLRLRDLHGRDVIDIFLDHHRKRLPPGVGRGALVTVHKVSRLLAKKRNGVYLRAMDVSLFCVDQAPRCDWAASPALPLAPTTPAVQISRLCCADAQVIDCCLSRIRASVVSVMRFDMHWTCTRCGYDVPEAFPRQSGRAIPPGLIVSDGAPWFRPCDVCTLPPANRPPGSVQLFLKGLSMLLEDGSGAAQCWADGDAAWALLGLWRGARGCPEVEALVKRHGHLSVREAWVHPDDWDGTAAQQITVRGRSALGEAEAAPFVSLIARALEQPSVVVWASRGYEQQDGDAEAKQPLDELAVLAKLPADCAVRETALAGRQVRAAMRRWPYLRAVSVEKLDARAEVACVLEALRRPRS